jgi:hypothetical protein
MDNQKKIYIIILILILSFLRTSTDVLKEIKFPTYQHVTDDKRNTYYKYKTFKRLLDIPIVVLSFIVLLNVKFNIRIYLFLFILICNLAVDYMFAIPTNNASMLQIFMDKYLSLWLDIALNLIVIFLLYKLFK